MGMELRDERKVVSVLFGDLVGSTALGYNQTQGRHWSRLWSAVPNRRSRRAVPCRRCAEVAREAMAARCRSAVDLRRAAYELGGAGAVGAGALAVVYL